MSVKWSDLGCGVTGQCWCNHLLPVHYISQDASGHQPTPAVSLSLSLSQSQYDFQDFYSIVLQFLASVFVEPHDHRATFHYINPGRWNGSD